MWRLSFRHSWTIEEKLSGPIEPDSEALKVGFVGLAASKMPQLFSPHADFVVNGEPEEGDSTSGSRRDSHWKLSQPGNR